MVLKTATAIVAGLMLAGCVAPFSPVPQAANFPATRQLKLQAAYHWNVIAGHIEKNLLLELKKNPARPLYINLPQQTTPFQRALATELTTALVSDGYMVSIAPAGSLKIDLDVQALTFAADRPQYRYFGEPAAIGGGVWGASEMNPPALLAVAGIAAAYDGHRWLNSQFAPGDTPKTEIIVTVSVSDPYRYFARTSSAYYVSDSDRALYGIVDPAPDLPQPPKLTKLYQVRGDK